jgi:hypothetical protein
MHRYASLLVLAGLMSATLHAQTPATAPAPAIASPVPAAQTAPPAPPQGARPGQTPPAAPAQPPLTHRPLPVLPAAAPGAATSAAAPRADFRALSSPTQNVRVDLTITDGTGLRNTDAAAVKVVTMLVADGRQGRIRSSNNVRTGDGEGRQILINVDAIPSVRADGRIELSLTIEYTPDLPQAATASPRPSSITESLTVLVADGKSTLISQSADPATARKVMVEVTATVIK